MIQAARPRTPRRRPLGDRHPCTLFLAVLESTRRPALPERDRFVISKGHAPASSTRPSPPAGSSTRHARHLHAAALAAQRPSRQKKVPGVEANTGPLGHGLPSLSGWRSRRARRLVAAHLLSRRRRRAAGGVELGGADGRRPPRARPPLRHRRPQRPAAGATTEETSRLEPLADKARAFGWAVAEVDGHDYTALLDLFERLPAEAGKPSFVIAHTHKGHGVSFMSDRVEWHHKRALGGATCRRRSRSCDDGRRAEQPVLYDCRDSFAVTLVALATEDERVVAVCNDSVGSSKLGGFQQALSGAARQRRNRRAGHDRHRGRPRQRRPRPVVSGRLCFLTARALEQIKVDVAYTKLTSRCAG